MEKQDPINDLLTQNGSETHPADIAEILHDQKTNSITRITMPIEQAINFYKQLDDTSKGEFLQCFNPNEQKRLLRRMENL